MSRKRLLVAAVVALVLVAGCAGAGGDGGRGAEPQSGAASGGGDGMDSGGEGGDGGAGDGGDAGDADASANAAAAVQNREIIKTGTISLEVKNATATRDRLEARVAELGGYASGTELVVNQRNNRTWIDGYVVVRVPSENFSRMMGAARASGIVRSENIETQDVTDQLVDLNARLENLRAERDRLRELYNRSDSTEDVLAVQERLSDVQGEIERLEARKRSLEDRVAYSTLRIELREPRPEFARIEESEFYEQSPLEALSNSVATLVRVARTLFLVGVIVLPWVAVAAVPVGGAALFLRWYVRRE